METEDGMLNSNLSCGGKRETRINSGHKVKFSETVRVIMIEPRDQEEDEIESGDQQEEEIGPGDQEKEEIRLDMDFFPHQV